MTTLQALWKFTMRCANIITPTAISQHGVFVLEYVVPILTPLQLKLARTAVGLGVRELAEIAGVAPSTIQRFESDRGGMQTRTLDKVQRSLEDAGVVFISADAFGGVGVRLKD